MMPEVYEDLRRLAASYLRGERSEHTLQRTALVHEAYLRLADLPAWIGSTSKRQPLRGGARE